MEMDSASAAAAAPAVSTGSAVFSGLALLVLSLVVLLIQRFYLPLRSTPAYLLVPVFFALWLPANMVLLVPIDLASSAWTDDEATRGIWLPETVLRVAWRITYWLTFALTWFILPILGEYSDAGFREPRDRILYSLRQNAQYHILVFGSGLVGLVYVFVTYGVSFTALKGLVMALAYCWGLILAIYLMGHGLVSIPRRLLRTATPARRLRRLQQMAPRVHEKLEEADLDLEDMEQQVTELAQHKTSSPSARLFSSWIDDLGDDATHHLGGDDMEDGYGGDGDHGIVEADMHRRVLEPTRAVPTVVTKKYMADVTRRLVRARHNRARYHSEWTRLVLQYAETQAIVNAAGSQRLVFPAGSARRGCLPLTPYMRYVVHARLVPYARMALGGLLALASAAIVWSELVKAAWPAASLVRLSVVHGGDSTVGLGGQTVATGWILYMCAAALVSVTEVRVWRGRALVKRNTAHESAFWYASQVARLSIPLAYNFLTFLSSRVYTKTVFYDFLGRLINLTPLGTWFDYVFPACLLLPVLATLFGLYGKARRMFGFSGLADVGGLAGDDEDDDGDGAHRSYYGTGSWREGRDLLERELDGRSIRQRRRQQQQQHDHDGRGHEEPDLVMPGSSGQTDPTTPFALSPSSSGILPARPQRPGGRVLGSGPQTGSRGYRDVGGGQDTDDSEDNFFQSLSHRMRNTMDTLETPRWFQDIGQGFKKPRWMGESGDGSSHASSSAAAEGGDGIRRWFGGSDGRIRL